MRVNRSADNGSLGIEYPLRIVRAFTQNLLYTRSLNRKSRGLEPNRFRSTRLRTVFRVSLTSNRNSALDA